MAALKPPAGYESIELALPQGFQERICGRGDHVFRARMMSMHLKVGVEVEKGEEDGLFTKETVYNAVRTLMEEESEFSREVKTNRAKLREFLSSKTLESSYIDSFNEQIQALLG
ncbi:hypothetical protein OIU84_028120 [Salix udensis]|uniref:Uncharacterized protein n=1 Tax=Salix udensis TaxID=889485 RepID=A0AAD6KBY6_9ROSI|nr:hypothetical protein OIU84_028120 [Salix udensis]